MICLNCKQETINPKFCCRSCAASYNNRAYPKRQQTEKFCKRCRLSLGVFSSNLRERRICDNCRLRKQHPNANTQTKGELRGQGNANRGGRYPYIRILSRKAYKASGRPMVCFVCGYSLHVDICHIRDVKDYPDDALVADINALTNLIALCKNHHWEFDHGKLVL